VLSRTGGGRKRKKFLGRKAARSNVNGNSRGPNSPQGNQKANFDQRGIRSPIDGQKRYHEMRSVTLSQPSHEILHIRKSGGEREEYRTFQPKEEEELRDPFVLLPSRKRGKRPYRNPLVTRGFS